MQGCLAKVYIDYAKGNMYTYSGINTGTPIPLAQAVLTQQTQLNAFAEQGISVKAEACIGYKEMKKLLKHVGIDACLGGDIDLKPVQSQIRASIKVSVKIGSVGVEGRAQYADGSKNAICGLAKYENQVLGMQGLLPMEGRPGSS